MVRISRRIVTGALAATIAGAVAASEDIADQYPQSELYAKPVEFIPHVFTAIGATAPPTYENSGHNNNLSFVVTSEGVVVVNGGASARLAAALHDEIKAVTDLPVKLVITKMDKAMPFSAIPTGRIRVLIFSPMKMRFTRLRRTGILSLRG